MRLEYREDEPCLLHKAIQFRLDKHGITKTKSKTKEYTDGEIAQILEIYGAYGKKSCKELCDEFSRSEDYIRKIWRGQTHNEITGAPPWVKKNVERHKYA